MPKTSRKRVSAAPRKQARTPRMGEAVFYYENGEALESLVLHAHSATVIDLVTVEAEPITDRLGHVTGYQGHYFVRREIEAGPKGWGWAEKVPKAASRAIKRTRWSAAR